MPRAILLVWLLLSGLLLQQNAEDTSKSRPQHPNVSTNGSQDPNAGGAVDPSAALALPARAQTNVAHGEVVNVSTVGAKCDWNGTTGTDDSIALQAVLNAGGIVVFPNGLTCMSTKSLRIGVAGTTIRGPGGVKFTSANQSGFLASVNATFEDDLKIVGAQTTASNEIVAGINVKGTTASSPVSKVIVRNGVEISNWGFYGLLAQYVQALEIEQIKIHDINYAGVMTLSVQSGHVMDSEIWNIQTGGASYSGNAYGISLNRASTPSAVTDPPTHNFIVARNRVHDLFGWECFDTHGGQNVRFERNIGWNCPRGIVVTSSTDGRRPASEMLAPKDVSVTDNILDSGVTDGSAVYGIAFTGASAGSPAATHEYATGLVSGNLIRGYGTQSAPNSACFYFRDTLDLSVTGNVAQECSPGATVWYYNNVGFTERSNTYIDFWTNTSRARHSTGSSATAFGNTGTIVGNNYVRGTKAATYVLERAIYVSSATPTNQITVGPNQSQATTYIDAPIGATSSAH